MRNNFHLLKDTVINVYETVFASQEVVSNSQETESISQEMKTKNGFLKIISQKMKPVSWEIFFISSMFSAEIDRKTSNVDV
jgi:hypothetical protein